MLHVLVIDDSRAMRQIVGKIMRSLGFEVTEAGDGQEGLAKLEEASHPFELVLVDWNMPVMDGLQFVEAVRASSQHADQKIVMVTTETEPTRMVKALMAGVDEFVMKPFTTDILVEKIKLIGVKMPAAQAT